MKKLIVAGLFLLFGGSAALAQTTSGQQPPLAPVAPIAAPAPAPVGPSIQFEEQRFDFGEIKPGDVVQHTFKFTNNGTMPLIISNVRTTCGCTATGFPKAPVRPGETAAITASFNSAGKRGQQNKVITIESNAVQGRTQVIIATTIVAAK
ncbi:DUF1573 domain-containing protein [Rufibacter glacialis]|uniref:DUF1573 domain-containing protein n=1 Tax=Rufibacter glacialis TaxID=1259555 RepID=A0A5M8QA92_9BACT|nr:DUF1573 domain-containing protein [Rufibacter glacialis]KAA6431780.1 DUF1573 domain-containing protein [Rufibacter glacialis]GGK81610.1 hypothetical protein GCM10011405_31800 [Rufibacter glacialis]